jgi:hypothetical protein
MRRPLNWYGNGRRRMLKGDEGMGELCLRDFWYTAKRFNNRRRQEEGATVGYLLMAPNAANPPNIQTKQVLT